MSRKSLGFIVITLGMTAAAWYISHVRAPETDVGTPPLLPDLAAHVNDIVRVEIKSRLNNVTLAREGDNWVIENRDRYPATFEQVKRMILGLSELKVLEPKTNRAEMYPRLGVEDVETEKSTSTAVMLKDQRGQVLASVLAGRMRENTTGPTKPARYVRKTGGPQAYLVEGELEVSADPMSWTARELTDIGATRIREVVIEHPGQPAVTLSHDKPEDINFALQNIPEGFTNKSAATLTSLSTVLEQLRFDDVRAAGRIAWPAAATVTTLRGFDGLTAKISTAALDGRNYSRFEFSFDPAGVAAPAKASAETGKEPSAAAAPTASVADEVKALNERLQNWAYVLPDYKQAMLTKTLDELIARKEEPKAPPPPPKDPLKVERFDKNGKLLPPEAPVPESAPPPAAPDTPDARATSDETAAGAPAQPPDTTGNTALAPTDGAAAPPTQSSSPSP